MLNSDTRRLLLQQRAVLRRREVRNLHQRLSEMPMAERTSALIVSILGAPDKGAVKQIARAIAVLELMAARMSGHDRIVASLLFAAAGAELSKDDGQRQWH
jgi:hypothetical protein